MRLWLSPENEVRAVEIGHADALIDNIPSHMLPTIRKRYPARLHSYVVPTTDFFQFNTMRKPFDDVRVRRALNAAIDRHVIVRLYGGSALAALTCQVLPPGVPGYRAYCPYSREPGSGRGSYSPDLERARRLVAASGTSGERVTVWGWTDDPTISEPVVRYVNGVLRRLGYRANVRLVPHAFFTHIPASTFASIQLIASAWGDTSYGFFANWFGCDGSGTHGWFCDPRIDRMNARARLLEATNPREAASLWAQIDRSLVDRAASLPMVNERGIDFLSARARNYQSHPFWGMLADQIWLE
jgi:peptide/nickel transport system substrate-binding protein